MPIPHGQGSGTITDSAWSRANNIDQPFSSHTTQSKRAFARSGTLMQWWAQACELYMITTQIDEIRMFDMSRVERQMLVASDAYSHHTHRAWVRRRGRDKFVRLGAH